MLEAEVALLVLACVDRCCGLARLCWGSTSCSSTYTCKGFGSTLLLTRPAPKIIIWIEAVRCVACTCVLPRPGLSTPFCSITLTTPTRPRRRQTYSCTRVHHQKKWIKSQHVGRVRGLWHSECWGSRDRSSGSRSSSAEVSRSRPATSTTARTVDTGARGHGTDESWVATVIPDCRGVAHVVVRARLIKGCC
jgi:hypothetical protein